MDLAWMDYIWTRTGQIDRCRLKRRDLDCIDRLKGLESTQQLDGPTADHGEPVMKTRKASHHQAAAALAGIEDHAHQPPIILNRLCIWARRKNELLTEAA